MKRTSETRHQAPLTRGRFSSSLRFMEKKIEASRNCQVMLVIGTSAIVQPAASLALEAKARGAVVVESWS